MTDETRALIAEGEARGTRKRGVSDYDVQATLLIGRLAAALKSAEARADAAEAMRDNLEPVTQDSLEVVEGEYIHPIPRP